MGYSKKWNQPSANEAGDSNKKTGAHSSLRWIGYIVLSLLALGIGVWWTISSRVDKESRLDRNAAPKSAKSEKKSNSHSNKQRQQERDTLAPVPAESTESLVQIPDSDQQLPSIPKLKEPPPPPKATFKHASDEIISMAVNTQGAIAPIPFDNSLEQDFEKSLQEEIVINDDDPDSLKQIKLNVIEAREAIKERIKQGMSVRAALEAHRDQVNFDDEMRTSAQREAQQILDSGDKDGAHEFVEKMNSMLEKYGIDKIEMPMTTEERRQKAIERVMEKQNNGESK